MGSNTSVRDKKGGSRAGRGLCVRVQQEQQSCALVFVTKRGHPVICGLCAALWCFGCGS